MAGITAQLSQGDELLVAPVSRSAKFRAAVVDRVAKMSSRKARLIRGTDYLPDVMHGSFLLPLRDGEVLLPGALSRLRNFTRQNPEQPCVRVWSQEDIPNNARRRLFGVPLDLRRGRPYLLHKVLLSRLRRQGLLRALRDDSPDIVLALEEAGGGSWFPENLLESHANAGQTDFSSDQTLALVKQYIRRRKLAVSVGETDGAVQVQADRPRGIDIELTNRCNAHCIFCPQRSMKRYGNMTTEVLERVLRTIREEPIGTIYFIGRGEPLMHPNFIDYIRKIRDLTGVEFELFTNGLALVPEVVDRLVKLNDRYLNITINVSLHSLKEETHQALTGTDLRVIAKNLRYLQSRADRLNVSYAFVTNKVNEEEMASLRRYLDRTGNRKWDVSLVYNKGGLIEDGTLFDGDFYRRHLGPQDPASNTTGPCWYSYCGSYYFVNYHGQFTLCHDDFREETILGEVGKDNLETIDARVAELYRRGGAPRCRRCNKRQRELFHGENIDSESRVKASFKLDAGELPGT
ncbi:MAG TPA: radical SAM/SPASM domain-containing protein [Myxococcota bacterium]|nr:radical SAM/SPASM domain-containing protein [Myxococcota bacterium]